MKGSISGNLARVQQINTCFFVEKSAHKPDIITLRPQRQTQDVDKQSQDDGKGYFFTIYILFMNVRILRHSLRLRTSFDNPSHLLYIHGSIDGQGFSLLYFNEPHRFAGIDDSQMINTFDTLKFSLRHFRILFQHCL